MIVVCVDNKGCEEFLTENAYYDSKAENDTANYIIDNRGSITCYYSYRFLSVQEYRERILNELIEG
jgi:hypothetical protein